MGESRRPDRALRRSAKVDGVGTIIIIVILVVLAALAADSRPQRLPEVIVVQPIPSRNTDASGCLVALVVAILIVLLLASYLGTLH